MAGVLISPVQEDAKADVAVVAVDGVQAVEKM